jgi:hypothetical protein
VVSANREVATKLLAAADMWLFVTTATRYADAVPWDLLRSAQQRGAAVAILLNRVIGEAVPEIAAHLGEMLVAHGLDDVPLFVLPETRVDGQGMLPEPAVAPVQDWFEDLATDQAARRVVVHRTLDGALAAIPPRAERLAVALEEQLAVAEELAEQVGMAYGAARATVERGILDGTLLSGEVLARWQEFISSGEWARSMLGKGRRGRLLRSRTRPGRELITALETGLVQLCRSAIADAVEHAYQGWSRHTAGAALFDAGPDLAVPAAAAADGSDDQVAKLVREWRRESLALVAETDGSGATQAAAQVTGALVLVGAAAAPAVSADQTADHEQVLAALASDETIRALAGKTRDDLLARITVLIDTEAARYLERLAGVSLDAEQARTLRRAVEELERARIAAGLVVAGSAQPPEPDAGDTDAGETDAGDTDAGDTDAGDTDAGETSDAEDAAAEADR